MRVGIDRSKCHGHARCAAVAADLYVLDNGGYIDTDGFEVPLGDEKQAKRGARACPERIVSIEE